MRNVLAMLYYLFAVVGCSGGRVTEIRSEIDGRDVLHGRIEVSTEVAKFECLTSSSGQCYFSLFDPSCTGPAVACDKPPDRFAVAEGASREIVGLPAGFKPCADTAGTAMGVDCRAVP